MTSEVLEIEFIDYSLDQFLKSFKDCVSLGKKRFLLEGFEEFAVEFLNQANAIDCAQPLSFYLNDKNVQATVPSYVSRDFNLNDIEVIFVFIRDPERLSNALMKYQNLSHCIIRAPITEHYCNNRPVFINSIPKGGTHLLIECVRAMGYKDPPSLDLPDNNSEFLPGNFYNLQHVNREFFSQQYSKIYKFVDAFSQSVVLFIYRDPRDIAVSMAHYLTSQKQYHILCEMMSELSPDERLSTVISGAYPIPVFINRTQSFSGNIRDLVNSYVDWIKHPWPNSISLRFEDLVGGQGGGDVFSQKQTIQKIQLALHVSGNPTQYCDKIFSPKALTFRKGQTGSHKIEFSEKLKKQFFNLPQDFMCDLGYEDSSATKNNSPSTSMDPLNSEKTFLLQDLHFKGKIFANSTRLPKILVESDYMGFNIEFFRSKYYAIGQDLGEIDITKADLQSYIKENRCFIDDSLSCIKSLVEEHAYLAKMIEFNYMGFNIAFFKNKYYAVAQELGEVDWGSGCLEEYRKNAQYFVASTLDEVKLMVGSPLLAQDIPREVIGLKSGVRGLKDEVHELEKEVAHLGTLMWFSIWDKVKKIMRLGKYDSKNNI